MKPSKTLPLFAYDQSLQSTYGEMVAGVDEVGRGPLAGPVVCCAVIMPLNEMIEGIFDSKKVTEKKREELAEKIKQTALSYHVAFVNEKVIDEQNILNATKHCMEQAIMGLSVKPNVVVVDAVKGLKVPYTCHSIVKGDATSYNVAAASIVAKVERDHYMQTLAQIYPAYGFDKNKGYGTKEHMQALREIGASPVHRTSFLGFLQNGKS